MISAGKPRKKKCKNADCQAEFFPERSFQDWCSVDCGVIVARMKQARAKAKREKAERAERRQAMEKHKRRGDHLREAQQAFNSFIRLRDQIAGHPCISSGRPLDWSGNAVDCGHYRSVGSAPHLRFDERNAHAQDKHDNRWKSGNAVDYRIGLIARIGLEAVEALEANNEPKRYTIEELKEIKAKYRALARELKRGMQ
jgi:hypothetical protein